MKNMGDVRSYIRCRIIVKGEQYKLVRNDTSVEAYAQVLLSNTSTQASNVIQRKRLIDATTHMRNKVLYPTTRIIDIPLIWQEIICMGVALEELWSIKNLVNILRDRAISQCRKQKLKTRVDTLQTIVNQIASFSYLLWQLRTAIGCKHKRCCLDGMVVRLQLNWVVWIWLLFWCAMLSKIYVRSD